MVDHYLILASSSRSLDPDTAAEAASMESKTRSSEPVFRHFVSAFGFSLNLAMDIKQEVRSIGNKETKILFSIYTIT